MKENDNQHFEDWSITYEDSLLQKLYFDRIHRHVLNLVKQEPAPSTILDIGCGTGRLLRKAKKRWPNTQLIGIDLAEGMIEKARQLLPDAKFIVCPAESLNLPDSSADLVLSTTSFHHWSDQEQALREVRRVLRKGGFFMLADISLPAFFAKRIHHGHIRTPSEVREMFHDAGFEVREQRHVMIRHILITTGT